jgi:ubiquinone/menaquinone biosynthesis C-methylase UbiE
MGAWGAVNRDDLTLKAFTELAPVYEETMDRELRQFLGLDYREFTDRLVEEAALEPGDWVLDLATGTAFLARRLAGQGAAKGRVVGLDITPAMLEQARARIAGAGLSGTIHLICASGVALPLVHGLFDTVFCIFGAHHMDLSLLLCELRRVLRPDGSLMLAAAGAPATWRSPWANALIGTLIFCVRLLSRDARLQAEVEAIRSICTSDEWRALLSEAGFSDVDISECPPRRPWYPRALTIRAQATGGGRANQPLDRQIEGRGTKE